MMRTAILERFSPGLAAAVTNVANARALIEAIERRQLFLVPLDDRGEWFRYHSLFGNCLREELAREAPGEVPALHRRACEWFVGAELWGEAVRHAIAAGDAARALAIVEGCAMDFVRRGDFLTLTALLRSFPDQSWRASVPLLLAFAWALAYSGGGAELAAILASVEARLGNLEPQERRDLETAILLIRLTIAVFEDDSERSRALLAHVDPTLGDRDAWASDIVSTGAAFIQIHGGQARLAREHLPCLYPFKRVYQQIEIALSWLREGRSMEAERELVRVQELALGEFGARSISNLLCQATLAPLHYERGAFDVIEQGLGNRLGMLDEVAPTDLLVMGYLGVAWTRAACGSFAQAEDLLKHLRDLAAARKWVRAEAWALLEIVRIRVAQGGHDFEDIGPRLDEIGSAELPGSPSTRWEAIQCARLGARFREAMRQISPKALDLLSAVVNELNRDGAAPLALKANLLLARALLEHGATGRARATMDEARCRARDLRMTRSVDDSGAWSGKLVSGDSLAASGEPTPAAKGIGVTRAIPHGGPGASADDLSQREREILGLAERGFSNKEIGKALKIAPETVKWHIKNLFAKLGVANRMQAVNRARSAQKPG